MKKIIRKIQSLLNEQDSSTYREIYNFNYEVDVIPEYMNTPIPPALIADETERKELIQDMVSLCIEKGIESRQCVLHKTYQDNDTLAACLSTMQAISRKDKIDLHVFVRSQNFDDNFCYDNQTYMMIMCELIKQFPKNKAGKIYVHITSLHRFMENGEKPFTVLVNNFC